MKTLYLLRHAKAVRWQPGINDFERSLSSKGAAHSARLADWMAANLEMPGAALCSPSRRTIETIEPVLAAWPALKEKVQWDDDLYGASTGTLHALASAAFETSEAILMVGHNPAFEYLLRAVLKPQQAAGITKMTTGALGVIDFDPDWEQGAGQGELRHYVTKHDV